MKSILTTKPTPKGRIRILRPSWYRKAKRFQSLSQQEKNSKCAWIGCTGGCNLCSNISIYNCEGMKLYN